ncbi:MAG: RNA polymerase sigma factor [bacterium]
MNNHYNGKNMKNTVKTKDPDFELVHGIVQGDERAFEQLMQKYEQAVFNTIYRYTGVRDDVEDLAQEIFVKVWKNAKKFKGKSKFSTWLYRITVNHCLDYRSRHKQTPVSLDQIVDKGKVPESLQISEDYDQKRKVALVRKALSELPERQRIALVLAQYEGLSYKEIADAMKISVSSVESLIFRARRTLRTRLTELMK